MRLIFLGTAAGKPSLKRNVTSLALEWSSHKKIWLFDCGEGTTLQLLKAHLAVTHIERIFITHLHGDHIFGLLGLLAARSMHNAHTPLIIHTTTELQAWLEQGLKLSDSHLSFPLTIQPLAAYQTIETPEASVEVHALTHRLPCFGFRLTEKTYEQLSLNREKMLQNNVPMGPWLKQLKAGKAIQLTDGRWLSPEDYVESAIPTPRVIAIFGDNSPTEQNIALAKNADLIVHEATYQTEHIDRARKYYHATSEEAALVAKTAQVKRLILTHISERYYTSAACDALLAEAQAIFPNTQLAKDLLSVKI